MPPVRRQKGARKTAKKPSSTPLKYVCPFPLCDWTHSRQWELTRHSQTHLTEEEKHTLGLYKYCSHPGCGYHTLQGSNLTTHERTHTNNRCKACPDCEFTTSDPGSLTKHKRDHHGYRPHRKATSQGVADATASLLGDNAYTTWQAASPLPEAAVVTSSSSSSSSAAGSPCAVFSDFSAQSWAAGPSSLASPRSVFADFSVQSWSASSSPVSSDPLYFASSSPSGYTYTASPASSTSSLGYSPSPSECPHAVSPATPSSFYPPYLAPSHSTSDHAYVASSGPSSSFCSSSFPSPPSSFPDYTWAAAAPEYAANSNRYSPYRCSPTVSWNNMAYPLPQEASLGSTPLRRATSFVAEIDGVAEEADTAVDTLVAKVAASHAVSAPSSHTAVPVAPYAKYELAAAIPPANSY